MSKLNLSDEDLAILRECFEKYIPDHLVLAYGSRVKGSAHIASDLDLVIQNPLNNDLPIHNLADIKEALSNSDIPILIDIRDWARLPQSFKDEITKNNLQIWP